MEIKGNTALITGSTGKLGREIALSLARAGCDCLCHYNTNAQAAQELAEEIGEIGQKATLIQADLTDESQIDKLFQTSTPVRILINSASVFQPKSLGEVDREFAQATFDINVIAPLMLCRKFTISLYKTQLDKTPFGKIINIADVAGSSGWRDYSVYCASKAALLSITKSLAKELSPAITVNAISPGIVAWPYEIKDDDVENQVARIPMGRFADAQEITSTIKFVLENDYLTGREIILDGGQYI